MKREKAVIYDEVRAAKIRREASIELAKKKVQEAKADHVAANKRAGDALKADDEQAYKEAKAASREALDAEEFHAEKLAALEAAPLYRPEEAAEKLSILKPAMESEIDKRMAEVFGHIDQACAILNSTLDEIREANDTASEITSRGNTRVIDATAYAAVCRALNPLQGMPVFDKYRQSSR